MALGDIAVNFIIAIGWMRGMKAVIDLGTEAFRIPLYGETKAFPINFHPPMKYKSPLKTTAAMIPKPNLDVFQTNKRLAFENLPTMDNFVTVIEKYNPDSGWLPIARDNAVRVRAFAAVNVPPTMGPLGILRGGSAQRRISNESERSVSFAENSGAQGEVAHNYNDNVTAVTAGVSGPAAAETEANSGVADRDAAIGQLAAALASVDSDSENVDLFGSTGSDSS